MTLAGDLYEGERTLRERFGVNNVGSAQQATFNSPIKVVQTAINQVLKNMNTDLENLVYVGPRAPRRHVQSDSKKLFEVLRDILETSGQSPKFEIIASVLKSSHRFNKDTWADKEVTYSVMIFGENELPSGVIPVTCYTQTNCLDENVDNYCGVELQHN